MEQNKDPEDEAGANETKVYLVGGGITSLAAAVFLIRDANVPGNNITILEELNRLGGSLDGTGSPHEGYVLCGGRVLESKYVCTYDLFSSIPTLDQTRTVTKEIFDWNETTKMSSQSRLVRGGRRESAPAFGLSEQHIVTLKLLMVEPEQKLGNSSIADQFDPEFFVTNFWLMWCTTFAFQPWHSAIEFKRCLMRFTHMLEGFNQLHGIMGTVYNHYDSMVRPLQKWLEAHGVRFALNTRVKSLISQKHAAGRRVKRIVCEHHQRIQEITVGADDLVIVTLGSRTESPSLGSMETAPVLKGKTDGGPWALWEKIATRRPEFGRPSSFSDHVDESKSVSFTTTLRDPTFFRLIKDITGNLPGEGGLVTLADSSWLASIVLPHQPHFIGQPKDVDVFWGYGLLVDKPGDFVKKPMHTCTGREIMTEIMGHLRIEAEATQVLATATCIPCVMPFFTSQFLRREKGDRPPVIPKRWTNLAFTGQFCELPDDVAFTIEYSVRSAMVAVYGLMDLKLKPPPVYKGQYDPPVLFRAFAALHSIGSDGGNPGGPETQ
jgi:oleate hydratase